MKKRKKAPQDVALMTGNPNDVVVVSPEEKPTKYQTEAVQAIKQLKSKLKAPDFVYIAPTERVDIDKKAEKQARDIKKLVSKLSTQEVTEEDLNNIFSSLDEAGAIKSILTSPVRAVGLLGKAAVGAGKAATLLSTPQSAAITGAIVADKLATGLSNFGKKTTSADAEKTSKYHTAIMKQNVAQSKERTKQAKIDTAVQKKRLDALNDIKKDVNKKIYSYNQANKGKDSIQTYSKSGVYGTPKSSPTSPTSDTAPSVIIPSTYKTRPSTSNTTIVSHREWDREKYIEEKNQLALQKKAEKYGVDVEIVENVFKQGLVEYDDRGNATINQFAMQRVNSFLANYLEEKKTLMIGGRRRRLVGEPPGAVYARTALKSSGKTKVLKTPMTTVQKQKRAVTTLKRKLKQKVYEDANRYMDSKPDPVTAKKAEELGDAAKKAFKPKYYEKDDSPPPPRKDWDYDDPDVIPIVKDYLNKKIMDRKPLSEPKPTTEESQLVERGLWDNIHAKRKRIKTGSGEKMRKPGSEGAPTKQNFVDAAESVNEIALKPEHRAVIKRLRPSGAHSKTSFKLDSGKMYHATREGDKVHLVTHETGAGTAKKTTMSYQQFDESFIVDRAAGYSTTYTAADLGIKIQGGFQLHPSVTEEGGAGDEGTNKLVRKYKKDTPGEAVNELSRVIRARRKANTQC
jgi:hypothetical protein